MRNDIDFILNENLVKHEDILKIIKNYNKDIITNFKVNNELFIKHLENIETTNEYSNKINENISNVIKNTTTDNIEEQLEYLKIIKDQLNTLNENNLISQEEFELLNENLENINKKFTKYNEYFKRNVGSYDNVKYAELLKRLKTEDKKSVITDIFKKTFDLKKDEKITGKSGLLKTSTKALGGLMHIAGLALDSPAFNILASEILSKRKEKIEKENEKEKEFENRKKEIELSFLNITKPIKNNNTSFIEQEKTIIKNDEKEIKNINTIRNNENFTLRNIEENDNQKSLLTKDNLQNTNNLLERILKVNIEHFNFIKEIEQDKQLDNKDNDKTFTKPIKNTNKQQLSPELLKSLQEMSNQENGNIFDIFNPFNFKKPGLPKPGLPNKVPTSGGGLWNKIKTGAGTIISKGKGILTNPKKLIGAVIISTAAAYGTKKLAESIGSGKENFKITSDFGDRIHPVTGERKFHNGVDINTPVGTPIKAPTSGIVKDVKNDKKGGLSIVFQGDDGYTYGYAHLNKIDVKPGQKLQAGDKLGETGNTGVGTGAHLHLTKKETATGEYVHPFTNQKVSEYATASLDTNSNTKPLLSKNNMLDYNQESQFNENISANIDTNNLKTAAVVGGMGIAGITTLKSIRKNTTTGQLKDNIKNVKTTNDAAKIGSKLSKIGRRIGKVASKVALPLAIASTVMDVYEGVTNAADIVGKDEKNVNAADKIKAAGASIISGLTFGIVSPKEVYTMGSNLMDKIDVAKGENNIVQDYSITTEDIKTKKINTNIQQNTTPASELSSNKNAADIKKNVEKSYNNSKVIQYIETPNKTNAQQTNIQPIVINNTKQSNDNKQPIIIKTNDDSFINMLYKSYYLGV